MPRPLTTEELKYKLKRAQVYISNLKTTARRKNGKLIALSRHNNRLLQRIVEQQDIIDKKDAEIAYLHDTNKQLYDLRLSGYAIDA